MKFAATLTVLASAALSVASAQGGTYTALSSCNSTSSVHFDASNYSISPSPMCIGKPFCMTASGTISTPITQGAEYIIRGRYIGHSVINESYDLCALLAANGTPCPIAAGAFNLNICVNAMPNLPYNMPLDYQFYATNGDSELIFCQITPDFPSRAPHPASGIVATTCA
ncbi:hypothetical protein BGZ95_007660 [Linnemannia exigua]|uniref:Phosphatidylglycerol/phosphatidylinositol transfer protein n=1 Tax=Linnemannia exigua TaxID=604196 RepID=A0AAD4H8W7_9FUNG|nr:hypothetical protein BGZ95_007660 [Linnemannia exigua]